MQRLFFVSFVLDHPGISRQLCLFLVCLSLATLNHSALVLLGVLKTAAFLPRGTGTMIKRHTKCLLRLS
ncbi:hypothetical protein BJX76DRAFT_319054 [Aspergillus varians]